MIDKAQDLLKMEHSLRDDYRELLELVVAFLGGVPHGRTQVQFMAPGPVHRARWMARTIYAFKIWMFWDQLQVTFHQCSSSSRTEPRVQNLRAQDFSLSACLLLKVLLCMVRCYHCLHVTSSQPRSSSVLGATFNYCTCHGSSLEKLPETPVVSFRDPGVT